MENELEKLTKGFIISEREYVERTLPSLIKQTMRHARVGDEGTVFVENPELSKTDRFKIILVARYLAHKIDQKISDEVSIQELASFTSSDESIVRARMSQLVEGNFVRRSSKGIYTVVAFYIKPFLDTLDGLEETPKSSHKIARGKMRPKQGESLMARILTLREEEFFQEPKSLKDVKDTLEQRGYFHATTAFPDKLLTLLRRNQLRRMKERRGKKEVWVYVNP